MKDVIRKLFSFILTPLESGDEEFAYRSSHRKILIVMGAMFSALAIGIIWVMPGFDIGYLIPIFVFGGGGIISMVVGFVGTDRAVAKIWGTK